MFASNFLTLVLSIIHYSIAIDTRHAWGYQCIDSKCIKSRITAENENSILALRVCRLYCYEDIGTLWPIPTGNVEFSKSAIHFDPYSINFESLKLNNHDFFIITINRFKEMQMRKIPSKYPIVSSGKALSITVNVESSDMTLNYRTDESYQISLTEESSQLKSIITAKNFFGARHAIETLSQLIVYDNLNNRLMILSQAEIADEPKFRHRGISMDTSRTFYPVDVIKRTIDGLAMTKLNTFHWHITDSQSFPMKLESHPDLAKYGAYSHKKVYSKSDIQDIVEFAKSRGVQVIPEFDTPARVGEGWQKKINLTTCLNYKPYVNFCAQPPCGHLDPSKAELYDVLEDIYREMIEIFNPPAFHMGGNKVFFSCWNASESLTQWMIDRGWESSEENFMKLWGYFQAKAEERLKSAAENSAENLPIILWTSELTEEPYAREYLSIDRYIIQVTTAGNDERIRQLLESGYKLIISNYDALSLDCGYGSWTSNRYISCSPYKEWQKIYQNDLNTMGGEHVNQIYGAEAMIWSETIDERNIEARVWPRVSALAERLWSNPMEHWRRAEPRLLMHHDYLKVVGGLAAEPLQHEWCVQNEGSCQL